MQRNGQPDGFTLVAADGTSTPLTSDQARDLRRGAAVAMQPVPCVADADSFDAEWNLTDDEKAADSRQGALEYDDEAVRAEQNGDVDHAEWARRKAAESRLEADRYAMRATCQHRGSVRAARTNAPRRPRCRGAGRPAARRTATSSSSRGDPDSDGGDDDLPSSAGFGPVGDLGARFTLEQFYDLTAGVSGSERWARFQALPPWLQDDAWASLADDARRRCPA